MGDAAATSGGHGTHGQAPDGLPPAPGANALRASRRGRTPRPRPCAARALTPQCCAGFERLASCGVAAEPFAAT
jgi:hypothetical protein